MSRNKYGNIKVEYDGIKFDSKKEMAFYQSLILRKKAGDIKDFFVKPTLRIYLDSNGKARTFWIHCTEDRKWFAKGYADCKILFDYTPDFTVNKNDTWNSEELIDVKGHQTKEFKLKKRILEALGIPIVLK